MRKLLMIVVCIVSLFVVTPFAIGFVVQKKYSETLTQTVSDQFKLVKKEYQRGWFKSTATTRIEIHDPELLTYYQNFYHTDQPLELVVAHIIRHGPVLLTTSGVQVGLASTEDVIRFSDETILDIRSLTEEEIPATASSILHFSGEVDVEVIIAALNVDVPELRIKMDRTHVLFTLSSSLQRLAGTFHNERIQVISEESVLQLSDVVLDIDQRHENNVPLGHWGFSFNSAEFSQHGEILLSGKKFNAMSNVGIQKSDAALIQFSQKVNVDTFNIEGESYGPGVLSFRISNIDKVGLEEVMKDIQNPDVDHFSKLLRQGLHVEMDAMNLVTPVGDVVGQLDATLPPLNQKKMNDLQYLRANSDVTLDLSAPIELVDTTPLVTQLPLMLMFGIVENKDGVYSVNVDLHEGKLQLNGKAMPF